MTKEEKSQVIEKLTAELSDAKTLYLTDTAGLNAQDTSALDELVLRLISDYL